MEYVGIADSLVLALYRNENVELLTPYHDFDAESIKLLTDLRKNGVVDIQERIRDQFSKVRYSANVSYGALNGDANAAKFLSSGFVPREGLESILLFSDGFFLPKCDPGADEDWNGFAALYRTGGLNGILEQVRNMERSDPECVLYPRSKLHDDASAIAIDFKK